MITDWESLVNALREEVQEYGGLLNLFDQQQAAILRREPDVVLLVNGAIDLQVELLKRCRSEREGLVQKCATQARQPAESSLRDLVPMFSEPVRPLLSALVDEINNLITRTRKRARQNQMLLSRSIEITRQILRRFNPSGVTTTYSNTGRVTVAVLGGKSRCISTS